MGVSTAALTPVTDPDPRIAQAFNLSSRSSSSRKIWLDFKGCNISGTAWNKGKRAIINPPYDKDGNPSNFSDPELSDIVAIWRAVAEDYAPFDVDVTTISQDTSSAAMQYVSRACIGGDGRWFGSAVGGVAYLGYFGQSNNWYYQPAWVFSKNLGPDVPKYVWEATSHEVGHNMGLSHDGSPATSYYRGQGDWAPIMGNSYYMPLTQWSKGEYTGANQKQDDTAIIASKLAYVASSVNNSLSTATELTGFAASGTNQVSASATSIVVKPGVADVYRFYAVAGTATITGQVVPDWVKLAGEGGYPQRSDLDMLITVYDSTGQAILSLNPTASITNQGGGSSTNGLGIAARDVPLTSAGWYYVSVAGTGSGDPKVTGYSNYASLGQYALRVALTPPPPANPSAWP